MEPALAAAFEETWPAAEQARVGGLSVGRGMGGGGRVSSARRVGELGDGDIDAAVAIHEGWGQRPLFRADDGDATMIAALAAAGFARENPTAILSAPVPALTDLDLPRVTAFAVWPPMAIQREIWAAGNISPARQAVMDRPAEPRTSILGRIEDRAAGAAFVAIHQGVAMVHGLEVLPPWRRRGLAGWMMRKAAFWAADHGAQTLALAVSRPNGGALALYKSLGFAEVGSYAYYGR